MQVDMPIQLFCVISTLGDFTPVKFKYMDSDQSIHTVRIKEVFSKRPMRICGREILCYRCHSDWEGTDIPIELRYDIADHRWEFKRRLDQGF